ncbi:MAG TPA: hypothetical protein VMR44_04010, partial [Thermoanaerobaculia bacterium]|nr:hypothetical protein [Thermoanaerobaculia bacterium]
MNRLRLRCLLESLTLALALMAWGAVGVHAQGETAPAEDPSHWALLAAERLPVLEVCRPEGAEEDMLCGTLSVWEDREAAAGRKIDLNVVVVPARNAEPEPDPAVPVGGGPGEGVTGAAPDVPRQWTDVLARRDVLLVDQRGTGKSNGLFCAFGITPEDPQPGY